MASHAAPSKHKRAWWKEATFYRIYIRSFKDSDGDGWGDIPGILEKVEYIASLGVDVVWLSPIFDSPQIDMGYDVSNYEAVYRPYGSVEDVGKLIGACHKNKMKIILDLAINHTSDQHAWFKESRSSKDNPKRGWYFWRPAKYDEWGDRMPPTNFRSGVAGTTWTWDEHTEEYYIYLYDILQPDLNWENKDCRQAIYDSALRFWLDKGIDGFYMDKGNQYSKVLPFTDAPVTDQMSYSQPATQMWCNGPRIHEFIKGMNRDVLSQYRTYDNQPVVIIGELAMCTEPESVLPYVSAGKKELDMAFPLDITDLNQVPRGSNDKFDSIDLKLPTLKRLVEKWQCFINGTDAWMPVFNQGHSNGRSVSLSANDAPEWRTHSAKMLAIWLAGQSGTLFLYQGQEIGMTNAPEEWSMYEDGEVESQKSWAEAFRQAEDGTVPLCMEKGESGLRLMSRDHAWLPYQWDDTANGGFSASKPWIPMHSAYQQVNAAAQEKDADSVLSFYKRMLRLRKEHKDVFVYGSFELLDPEGRDTFVYRKRYGKKMALLVFNFSTDPCALLNMEGMRCLVSSYSKDLPDTLRPLEGRVYVDY